VFPPGLGTSEGEAVDLLSTNRYSLTTLTDSSNNPSNRERKVTKALQTEGPGTELPPESYRGHVGVTDQARMYVTTCSETFPLRPQTVPDSEQPLEKRGLNCEELHDRYTGPPRGTAKELGYP